MYKRQDFSLSPEVLVAVGLVVEIPVADLVVSVVAEVSVEVELLEVGRF